METALAYHTTGRSAALFVVNYGAQGSRPLGLASRSFFEDPPEGTTDGPLVTRRGLLWIADETQLPGLSAIALEGEESGAESLMLSSKEVIDLIPVMRPDRIAGGLYEPSALDIDVAGLHQAFVRIARRNDAEIRAASPVMSIERHGSGWAVTAADETFTCRAIVNASGAWGDEVAALAGIPPIGLQPMRRTAFMVPGNHDYAGWPMVVDADQRFYFKPDGVQLLCSLAEEEPSQPTDAKPRMEDVALAIERINDVSTLGIRSVNSQWTGLRTFSPDRDLVIGEEPTTQGFFWLVGQGGTGIQTSPAYGSLLASRVLGTSVPEELVAAGVDPATTDPRRFRD
jgi:D-arginine dehydrogenase